VLAADKNAEYALRGLLKNPRRLGVREIQSMVFVHPKRDPGVLRQCHEFLRSQLRRVDYALVVFDCEGCGRADGREAIEGEVEIRLAQNGWAGRCAAVAIDPELEAWVWGEYGEVAASLAWTDFHEGLRAWLVQSGYLEGDRHKPARPKEAFEAVLYQLRRPRSSSLCYELASRLSFEQCLDRAFLKVRRTLAEWFPAEQR